VRSTKLTDEARAMGRSVIAKRAADKAADYAPIILDIHATGITSLASITAARSTSAASRPLGCPRDRRSLATQSTLAGPSARWPRRSSDRGWDTIDQWRPCTQDPRGGRGLRGARWASEATTNGPSGRHLGMLIWTFIFEGPTPWSFGRFRALISLDSLAGIIAEWHQGPL
jgi:hypothetical protein